MDCLEFRYKFCSHFFSSWIHAFVIRKSAASLFESQKQFIFNIFTVKLFEKDFVQTENYSNRSQLPVMETNPPHFYFGQFEKYM